MIPPEYLKFVPVTLLKPFYGLQSKGTQKYVKKRKQQTNDLNAFCVFNFFLMLEE
jgi:hypothetical protein